MKPLLAAVLLATASVLPTAPQPPAPHPLASTSHPLTSARPLASAPHRPPCTTRGAAGTPAAPGGPSVVPEGAEARIRPGSHVQERNVAGPGEAAAAERQLDGLLARLGAPVTELPRPSTMPDAGARRRTPADQVRVPVYFHVLHNGATGNISDALVRKQISAMNSAYGGRYGGADTGFSFDLQSISRSDNASWYTNPEATEKDFKPRLRRGGAGALNLYSADLGDDLLGWSTFPWLYKGAPKMDGVVVHLGSMPGGSIDHFNRGFSAVHETGHWLGLFHPFEGGCTGPGDYVDDTPPERDATNGCPATKDTCPAPGTDPIHNFMDYSWDTCMNQFTPGQGVRAHKVYTAYRT